MSQTKFTQVNFSLNGLISQIELGQIGLPEIQRPFVWSNRKVRNLFDSMFKGYPVGYFLFWQTGADGAHKQIGDGNKQVVPNLLVVDGQQRLTSLFAVVKGATIIDENYKTRRIEISFCPGTAEFQVANAATRRDPEFIANISEIWSPSADLFGIVDVFLKKLREYREGKDETLAESEVQIIKGRISQLSSLINYPFTALVISQDAEPEEVSDIFVRINSQGERLDEADFILTLMSVHWDEGRKQLEDFARRAKQPSLAGSSPYNHFIEPSPDQLLRVSAGVGFNRAVLQYVYSLLRGKDLQSKIFAVETRDKNFEIFRNAQERVLNIQNWHDHLHVLQQAGFRGSHMISSEMTVIYSYLLYLVGKFVYKVKKADLDDIIARWFFMSSLTGRYTNSPESAMERDLTNLSGEGRFLTWLEQNLKVELTDDFWKLSLPNALATPRTTGPRQYAYLASQNLLGVKVLYSKKRVSDLLDPAIKAKKKGAEHHHLFPKAYLKETEITEKPREYNQFANQALVEWSDNISISSKDPKKYAPAIEEIFPEEEINRMYTDHALPPRWFEMEYWDFIAARQKLMAQVIRRGYQALSKSAESSSAIPPISHPPVEEIISSGEGIRTEFKSTLRVNLHTGEKDIRMELAVLKTIAAFLNSQGGYLIIGVDDSGHALGLDKDAFSNEDKMNLHLVNLIRDKVGSEHMLHIQPRFLDYQGKRILLVVCSPAHSAVFVKSGNDEQFFIRSGAATTDLPPSRIQQYIAGRF